jgi:hypothetical protein
MLAAARGRVPVGVPGEGPVGWLSTAAVLMRRSAWDSVDGLDPRYLGGPGDMGDVDLGERLVRAGWLVVHEPAANAFVEGAETSLSRTRTACAATCTTAAASLRGPCSRSPAGYGAAEPREDASWKSNEELEENACWTTSRQWCWSAARGRAYDR